jgi:CheY-like chemotaxis protein
MYRVLIIDDESSVRTIVRIVLERQNCCVDEAEDGRRGLEQAHQNHPDLILCDLDMPVLDGFETLLHVRNDPVLRTVPVIVVSGHISEDSERRVMRLGANAVLRKPFSFAALTSLVRSLLEETKPPDKQVHPPVQ